MIVAIFGVERTIAMNNWPLIPKDRFITATPKLNQWIKVLDFSRHP